MPFSSGPVPAGDPPDRARLRSLGCSLATIIWLGTLSLPVSAVSDFAALSCVPPATVDLITAASASDVVGVVEYEVIAENGSSFGKSVGASRRIWGGVVAARWMVTSSRSDCPSTPAAGLGDRWYLLIGTGDRFDRPVFGAPSGAVLSDLEAGALASIVGEPVSMDIGSLDRAMAWTRVNWWLLTGGMIPVIAVVAVVRRRRSGGRRDYLF